VGKFRMIRKKAISRVHIINHQQEKVCKEKVLYSTIILRTKSLVNWNKLSKVVRVTVKIRDNFNRGLRKPRLKETKL